MARWEDVLDLQLDTHNWLAGPNGRDFGAGYFHSAYQTDRRDARQKWSSVEDARNAGANWAHAVGVAAFNAEPIWVDPDMMSVVEGAIVGFQPEPLQETDLITPNGFLVLPRSMDVYDVNGKRLTWKAALWFPVGDGINLTLLHDPRDPDDIDAQFTMEMQLRGDYKWTGKMLPTHVLNWRFGRMHAGAEPPERFDIGDLEASDTNPRPTEPPVPFDFNSERKGSGEAAIYASSMEVHRQVQGIWRLLSQYLAVHERRQAPRAFRKRAKKAQMPGEHVTVVRLRRPPQEPQEPGVPTLVHWTRRWIVGGHWRNQWYPSLGIHRQIFISPFVKGPEEMPLVVNKARIFELVR